MKGPQICRKFSFCSKMVHGHVKFSFDIPYIFFPAGSGKFFTQCPQKMRKFLLFVRKVSLFGMVLSKHRKTFWRPRRNFSVKKLNFLAQFTINFRKKNNLQNKKFSLMCSYGHVVSTFDRPIEFLLANRIFFHSISKKVVKTSNYFQKKVFHRNVTLFT